ncbi:MAG TPA: hypothetical protein VH186_26690 [Chloroflexia bacterium]|nr:hypothetical protein [Chloroflexia bacterium]
MKLQQVIFPGVLQGFCVVMIMLLAACGDTTATSLPASAPTASLPSSTKAVPTSAPPTVTTLVASPVATTVPATAPLPPAPTPTTVTTLQEFKLGSEFQLNSGQSLPGSENLKIEFVEIIQDYRCGHISTDPVTPGVMTVCSVDAPAVIKLRVSQNNQNQLLTVALYSPSQGGSDKTPASENVAHFGPYSIRLRNLLYQPCSAGSSLKCPYFATLLVEKPGPVSFSLGQAFGLSQGQSISGPDDLQVTFVTVAEGKCPDGKPECFQVSPPAAQVRIAKSKGQSQTFDFTLLGGNPPQPASVDFDNFRLQIKHVYPSKYSSDPTDYLLTFVITQK